MPHTNNPLQNHSPFADLFHESTMFPFHIMLDFAASTPVFRQSIEAMIPFFTQTYGNPAARLHPQGDAAALSLNAARQDIAHLLGVSFEEITFTASATESNNLLLRGLVLDPFRRRKKILFGATEHSSIATTALALEQSFGPTWGILAVPLPVDENGQIDLNHAEREIDANTLVVAVMDVNNETGLRQTNLSALSHMCKNHGALLHVDAAQGLVRHRFSGSECPFDSASISSAKVYGPRGAAALIVRKTVPRIRLSPQLTGGGHEGGLRSSTPNVAALAGFASALSIYLPLRSKAQAYYKNLDEVFWTTLEKAGGFERYGADSLRAPGIRMISCTDVNAMKLVETAGNVCVSVGSACRTLQATASHVLLAMGVPLDAALASFRVSFGMPNTMADAHMAATILAEAAEKVRRGAQAMSHS